MSNTYTDTSGRSDSYNAGAAHDSGFYDPTRHDNQIVAVFEDRAAADRAREALLQAGVAPAAVQVVGHVEGDAVPGNSRSEDSGSVGDEILGAFMSLFSPRDEHRDYSHAVDRGHAMVVVTPTGDTDRHKVIEALERSEPIDFDAKLAEWRQAGYDASGAARTPTGEADDRRIGRRDPSAGTPLVRSYVADRPDSMGTGGTVTNATPGAGSSGTNSPRL